MLERTFMQKGIDVIKESFSFIWMGLWLWTLMQKTLKCSFNHSGCDYFVDIDEWVWLKHLNTYVLASINNGPYHLLQHENVIVNIFWHILRCKWKILLYIDFVSNLILLNPFKISFSYHKRHLYTIFIVFLIN